MEVLKLDDIVRACRGIPYNVEKGMQLTGISTDSRKIQKGELFIPLKGERFDGHDYISEVYNKGIQVVLSEKHIGHENKPYIIVENTLTALQDIASWYKDRFDLRIVAVTGSSGKTTTKDMIASVLSQRYKVLKTEGNLNNAIGLPMTLLNLDSTHQIAVLEMGMNSLGEIEKLAYIARPDIGVITNVGTAHIERLKTRENILKAKLELYTYFNSNNLAIINGDNDLLRNVDSESFQIIKFGLDDSNDISAINILEHGEEGVEFEVDIDNVIYEIKVPVPGLHNVYNALTAICIGLKLNMNMKEIKEGISKFKPSKLRMDIFNLRNNIRIINDAYNANPESMYAAISTLASFNKQGRTVCILGDMLELGDEACKLHSQVGRFAHQAGVGLLITVGALSEYIRKGAVESGFNTENAYHFNTNAEACKSAISQLKSGDTVLIKGSRGMQMEEIVEYLRERG